MKPQWLKLVALAWGPLVALSTIATANHSVFDVVCGLAVTAIGYTLVTPRPTGLLHGSAPVPGSGVPVGGGQRDLPGSAA